MSWRAVQAVMLSRHPALSVGGRRRVLAAFASYVTDDGEGWPSRATIAATLGVSPRHVRQVVTDLAQLGILVATGETRGGGGRLTPVRRIDLAALEGGSSATPQGGSGATPQGGSGATPQGGSGTTPKSISESIKESIMESRAGGGEERAQEADALTAWPRLYDRIASRVTRENLRAYFAPLVAHVEDGVLHLSAQGGDEYVTTWIVTHYRELIAEASAGIIGTVVVGDVAIRAHGP